MEGNLIGHRTRDRVREEERKGYRIERTAICISLAYVRGRESEEKARTDERMNERGCINFGVMVLWI